uniref:Uncharacterized protein n=1 Tax=Arundo donax TaxID=35708 RepID=A0A0A9DIT5_ARUDO
MTFIDVHPSEPLILTGHQKYVCIWKAVQWQDHRPENAKGFDDTMDFVVKFIPRRNLILTGDSSGKINVRTRNLELVHKFTAHGGRVRSLAVHPSQRYVLSSSDDHLIKLWDWDNDWTCTQEFRRHTSPVTQVAFNPKDTNTFASVSGPNIKVLRLSFPMSFLWSRAGA